MLTPDDLIIDEEFRDLLPPLSEEEQSQLRQAIERDGYRDKWVVWLGHGIIVDGYNRFAIWDQFHRGDDGFSPEIEERHFADREAVKLWIVRNQLGRRNLTDAWRVKLALQLKPELQAKAKERMAEGCQNSDDLGRVDEQVAELAGKSRDTVRKVERVLEHGDDETQAAMLAGDVSINAADKAVRESAPRPQRPPQEPAAASERQARALLRDLNRMLGKIKTLANSLQDEERAEFIQDVREFLGSLEGGA